MSDLRGRSVRPTYLYMFMSILNVLYCELLGLEDRERAMLTGKAQERRFYR